MQFIITRQIAVEAETPEEAVAKISEGKTIALNVTMRPQQVQPGIASGLVRPTAP